MDLNHLYSEHQASLMRADAAPSRLIRTVHLNAAVMLGIRIRDYQLSEGAAAASGWNRTWPSGSGTSL